MNSLPTHPAGSGQRTTLKDNGGIAIAARAELAVRTQRLTDTADVPLEAAFVTVNGTATETDGGGYFSLKPNEQSDTLSCKNKNNSKHQQQTQYENTNNTSSA